ncbi:MAG: cupin domain-containing protein [Acidobacteria bacterium]|nr:cupin domain-containing protein [Acidobacteriota bacterium]
MRLLMITLCVGLVGCTTTGSQRTAQSTPPGAGAGSRVVGFVLQPQQGKKLFFCDAPGLNATVKSNSAQMGGIGVAVGTAEITHGSNFGVHKDEDEIVFIHSGKGNVVLGDKTIAAAPGTIMYVPRGVRHGFVNTGEAPFTFFWVVAPPGLADRFLEAGTASLTDCPAQ